MAAATLFLFCWNPIGSVDEEDLHGAPLDHQAARVVCRPLGSRGRAPRPGRIGPGSGRGARELEAGLGGLLNEQCDMDAAG